jgi:hypothetical protein
MGDYFKAWAGFTGMFAAAGFLFSAFDGYPA